MIEDKTDNRRLLRVSKKKKKKKTRSVYSKYNKILILVLCKVP